jgi:hypothetical protein
MEFCRLRQYVIKIRLCMCQAFITERNMHGAKVTIRNHTLMLHRLVFFSPRRILTF